MIIVAQAVNYLFQAINIILFIYIVLSWLRVSPYHPTWGGLVRFTYQVIEPLLAPIRGILPSMGGLDFSPIILILGLNFLRQIIVSALL